MARRPGSCIGGYYNSVGSYGNPLVLELGSPGIRASESNGIGAWESWDWSLKSPGIGAWEPSGLEPVGVLGLVPGSLTLLDLDPGIVVQPHDLLFQGPGCL